MTIGELRRLLNESASTEEFVFTHSRDCPSFIVDAAKERVREIDAMELEETK